MKNLTLFLIIALTAMSANCFSQNYIPVATVGYSLDGIAENTTAVSTTGGALDASDFILYSQFYGTLMSTSAFGLPNNGLLSNATRTYQLQSYTAFNSMHLFANTRDTLYFITPQPCSTISLLGFGSQGVATASITVRFTDNSTQVFSPITMDDWFGTSPSVFSGFDRALRTTGIPALVGAAGNPKMFGFDLAIACANQGKSISKIIINNISASAHVCVMAVAQAIPSYSINVSPSILCSGSTATLTANGLASYSWQAVGAFPGSNASVITVTPGATTSYTLLGDNAGCPAYATTTITVSGGLPSLSLSGSTSSVCLGAAATITASGAINYTLSSPSANGGTFTPSSSSIYTVIGGNGCGIASQTIAVTVTPLQVSAISSTAIVCAGSPVTFTALGASNYTWLPSNSTASNYIVSPTSNSTYTVLGRTGNCNGSNTIAVATKPIPTLTLSSTTNSVCLGDSLNLVVSGNAVSYLWTPGNQTATSIYVTPSQLTLYSVVGTNSVNCTNSAQQAIFVNQNPSISVQANSPVVCSGAPSTLIASGATTYTWSQSALNFSTVVNPQTTSVYSVTGSYTTGCSSSKTITVQVFSPTISISGNTAVCLGSSVVLTGGTASTYTWSNGLPGQQFVNVTPISTTVYSLTASVANANGLKCPANNSFQVTVYTSPTITISSSRTNSNICVGEFIKLTGAGAGSTGTYTWNTGVGTPTVNVNPNSTRTYTIRGTDNNGCEGFTVYTVKVNVCNAINTENSELQLFTFYPNPSNGAFRIKSQMAVTLGLHNDLGQLIMTVKLTEDNNFAAEVENLAAGIYYIQAAESTLFSTQKIIIH